MKTRMFFDSIPSSVYLYLAVSILTSNIRRSWRLPKKKAAPFPFIVQPDKTVEDWRAWSAFMPFVNFLT